MRLLHVLSSVDPAGGGVAEAVRQSGLMCIELGHDVEVVSLDSPGAAYLEHYPLKTYALGPSRTGYAYNASLVPWLRSHADKYQAIIINGLWQYHSLGTWRALRGSQVPFFVFTHGMLDPWFKQTYPLKHLKKWLYWPWGDYRVLRDARAVLFTCEEERLLARQSFWLYKAKERVAAFGTRTPPQDLDHRLAERFISLHPELEGKRVLLFLGRLHPKKGCDILIEAFARVAVENPELHLVLAGPDQTGWQSQLESRVAELSMKSRISFTGMLKDDDKWGAFYASEAHVLPSHQENFGIAVAEALGCGSPVLISDKVNIWREIEADGAGFVAGDTLAGTESCLRRWLALTPAERFRMSRTAKNTFERRYTVRVMAESLIDIVREHAS